MITVYGIRQCDTCRKALKWLEGQGAPHRFHDLRADGLDAKRVRGWLATDFAGQLINRRSTTWRGLTDAEKACSGADLEALLVAHPPLIKRPVFEIDGWVIAVGFRPGEIEHAIQP